MHDEAQTRADAFRGFQEMKGNSSMPGWSNFDPWTNRTAYQAGRATQNATSTGQSTRAKSAYEYVNSAKQAPYGQTPFGAARSQSTKKKNGFDPGAPGGDEPMARNTSAYSTVPRGERSQACSAFFEPAPSPTAKKKTAGDESPRTQSREGSPVPGFERLSTRYASTSGERTYFSSAALRRSTSVRETTSSSKPRSRTNPPSPTSPHTGRHHSASPKLKTDRNRGFSSDETSSDEDEDDDGDDDDDEGPPRDKPKAIPKSRLRPNQKFSDFHIHNDRNPGSGEHPSAWANIAGFWTPLRSRSRFNESRPRSYHEYTNRSTDNRYYKGHDSDSAAFPNGSHRESPTADPEASRQPETQEKPATTGETEGSKTQFNLYGPTTPNPSTRIWSEKWGFSAPRTAQNEPRRKPPYWAYPSSVMAPAATSPKRFKVAEKERRAAPKPEEILASIFGVHISFNESAHGKDLKTDSDALHSFDGPTAATPSLNGEFKSRSHESLRTTFSASDWHGTFQGAADFFAPAPSGKDQGTRRRVSPTRGRTTTRQVYGSHSKPTASSQDSARTPLASQQQPTPFADAKFSPGSWSQQLKDATWTMPFGDGVQPQANTRRARSPVKQSRPTVRRATAPQPACVSTETEEAKTTLVDSSDESAKDVPVDGEAMDIDDEPPAETDVPPANTATSTTAASAPKTGPRLVSVEPNRPEWRSSAREEPTTQQTAAEASGSNKTDPEPSSNSGGKTSGVNTNGNLFNLKNLSNVTPLAPTNNVGIEDLNDIHANLPFESRPNENATRRPVRPRELNCPNPPKRPSRPLLVPAAPGSQQMVLPRKAWERYVAEMHAYMREWNEFNRKMLRHFNARQEAVETGLSPVWISAVGDSTRLNIDGEDGKGDDSDNSDEDIIPGKPTGGFSAYLRGVEEDFKVRAHWDVAWERHRDCIWELGEIRAWIRNGGKVV